MLNDVETLQTEATDLVKHGGSSHRERAVVAVLKDFFFSSYVLIRNGLETGCSFHPLVRQLNKVKASERSLKK